MKDVNDLMQAILEMDAAQRKASEKAKTERTARLAALDEQKQKIIAECDAREKPSVQPQPRPRPTVTPPRWRHWSSSAGRLPRP